MNRLRDELANHRSPTCAATRATGQIGERPAGFSVATLNDGVKVGAGR